MMPTLTYCFDILSDILSGILPDIYPDILSDVYSGILSDILSGILSDIHSDILSDIRHSFRHSFWHLIWHLFWHSFRILSDICSDILSGSLSCILSDMCSGPGASWAGDMVFGSRRAPQHPELAIWLGSIHAQSQTSWQKQEAEKVDDHEGGERGEEGGVIVPLLRSREPHLADGEQCKVECETLQTSSNYNFELHTVNERHGSLVALSCCCPPKPSARLDNDIIARHLRQTKRCKNM